MTGPKTSVISILAAPVPARWLALVLLCACDDGAASPRLGDPCDPSADPDPCHDQLLWCAGDGLCRERPIFGQVCDPAPCAGALWCHIDKRCGELRLEGEACASALECTPGLRCNHGELPELFAVGLCRSPAAAGEPCGYGHAPDELTAQALPPDFDGMDRGDCAVGLGCAPDFPSPGSGESPPICADTKGVACFFSGVCTADGALADGAPCLRAEACQSGVCAVFAPPLSATALPGFGKGGEWLGPQVGLCVRAGDAISTCGRADPCPDDFTCLERSCIAPHTQRPGALCSDPAGVECAFGLVCDGRSCGYL